MGTETELKFEVSPTDLGKLKTARTLRRRDGRPAKEEYLVSIYFDTDKHELRTNGVSLRVRQSGDKRVQTIKTAATGVPFSRSEWEHKIDALQPPPKVSNRAAHLIISTIAFAIGGIALIVVFATLLDYRIDYSVRSIGIVLAIAGFAVAYVTNKLGKR